MRSLCRTLALVWLSLAGVAAALAETAPAETLVRLAAPRHGEVLQAGELAVLAWEPLGPFGSLSQVVEWEAFFSLDGGAHYPVRITPHLDRELRRILWQVPSIPTRDARLLLRFGNERRETAVELPQRFAISGSAPFFGGATASIAPAPGEPARPGDPGVVAWVEGERHGGSARQVIAPDSLALAAARSIAPVPAGELALETEDPVPNPAPLSTGGEIREPHGASRRRALSARAVWVAPIPILLLIQRQNE